MSQAQRIFPPCHEKSICWVTSASLDVCRHRHTERSAELFGQRSFSQGCHKCHLVFIPRRYSRENLISIHLPSLLCCLPSAALSLAQINPDSNPSYSKSALFSDCYDLYHYWYFQALFWLLFTKTNKQDISLCKKTNWTSLVLLGLLSGNERKNSDRLTCWHGMAAGYSAVQGDRIDLRYLWWEINWRLVRISVCLSRDKAWPDKYWQSSVITFLFSGLIPPTMIRHWYYFDWCLTSIKLVSL